MTEVIIFPKMLQLSEKQLLAIREILQGKTDVEVAETVGVSRKTICSWKRDNPLFLAELNTQRLVAWEKFVTGFHELSDQCFNTIKKAIVEGDVKTARWFLEKIGLDKLLQKHIQLDVPKGPTDPEQILLNRARDMAEKKVGVKKKSLMDEFDDLDFMGNGFENESEIKHETKKNLKKLLDELSKISEID